MTSTAWRCCADATGCEAIGRRCDAPTSTAMSWLDRYAHSRRIRAEGIDLWPSFSAAPSYVNLHFERSIMWHGVPAWHEMVNGPATAKARASRRRRVAGPGTDRMGRLRIHPRTDQAPMVPAP